MWKRVEMRTTDVTDHYRIGSAVDDTFWVFYKGNQSLCGISHSPPEQYHTPLCNSTAPGRLLERTGAEQWTLQFI